MFSIMLNKILKKKFKKKYVFIILNEKNLKIIDDLPKKFAVAETETIYSNWPHSNRA